MKKSCLLSFVAFLVISMGGILIASLVDNVIFRLLRIEGGTGPFVSMVICLAPVLSFLLFLWLLKPEARIWRAISSKANRPFALGGGLFFTFLFFLFGLSVSSSSVSSFRREATVEAIALATDAARLTATITTTPSPTPTATTTPSPTATSTNTPVPTNTNTATPNPIAIPAIDAAACVPIDTERQQGRVTHVVDGDTIDVEINGQVYRVRYIGIDTPEMTTQIEYFGKEASVKNAGLVSGETVTLVKDVSETDRYGRLLRYVFVGNTFVNYELVRQGFANPVTYPPDVACERTFAAAEQSARESLAGLWAPTPVPQVVVPPPTNPPVSSGVSGSGNSLGGSGDCDPAYPDVCIPPKSQVGDLDCGDIPYRRFRVLSPDPHRFDGDHDGVGCES